MTTALTNADLLKASYALCHLAAGSQFLATYRLENMDPAALSALGTVADQLSALCFNLARGAR